MVKEYWNSLYMTIQNTEIDNFVKALNNAGYQDILDAKQEQLDAWLAE